MSGFFFSASGTYNSYRVQEKCKQLTKSNNPNKEEIRLIKLDEIIRGWVNYFVIAKAKSKMQELDEMLRNHMRINTWKRWKLTKTKISNLIKPGREGESLSIG